MALALGEDGDEDVGPRDLFAARRLHVNHRALNDALEAGGRLGIFRPVGDEIVEFGFEIGDEAAAQLFEIHIAGPHDGGRILIFDQREQEMFQRRVFVVPLIGERQCPVKRLFKAARERGHSSISHHLYWSLPPGITSSP